MSFEHAQIEHQILEKKAGEVVKSSEKFLEKSERDTVLKTYGEKIGKHLRQLKALAESEDLKLKSIGHEALQTFLITLKEEHDRFVTSHQKESARERASDILELARNFNFLLEKKISLFEGAAEKARPKTQERRVASAPESFDRPDTKAPEKEKTPESFDWLFIGLEERIKSYDRQVKSYQGILKGDGAATETALQELHALHEKGGNNEDIRFVFRKIDDAAQSKKRTFELIAQLSKQYSDLFEQDIEKLLKDGIEYTQNNPQKLKAFEEAFQNRMQSQPDFVRPLLGMVMMKKQVEAREKSPQGTILKVFSLIRACFEQARETEKLTRLTTLEKLLFEDSSIDSLKKLREKIPKGDGTLTALIQEIDNMSKSSLSEKIEGMQEKNQDPLFRLQLIWNLMEGGERAKDLRVQKFHQELTKLIKSGEVKDIPQAISKINRPDDAMAWEQAFRRGRGGDATINSGAPTSPRALGDLWASDLTQSESRSYLIRKTAEVLLNRGNPEDRAKGRKMLSDMCYDLIEKEKMGSLSELESMNLAQEKKETFEKSRVMAYEEQGSEKNRQKLYLEIANAMLADNIKEGLGDQQKIDTIRGLLEEQGKNLDTILEQSIYASSTEIAEKAAEEQVQKKFLAIALKYTDIEKLTSESVTDKDQNQIEALRLLQQSTGAKGISDETYEWVKWFGEEAVINAALLAVSAGVGNLARAGTKAGLKFGETTLRKALEHGGRATLQWAGKESVLLGAESLAFHEMNTLLQAGIHGDISQWYGQSLKDHLKGWGHSYVTLGILKATSTAYAKTIGERAARAAAKRAEEGSFVQSGALNSFNYLGGLATETAAFQLSSLDKEALSDPKAWVNSLMSVIALRVGGALPHSKAIHEAGATLLKPQRKAHAGRSPDIDHLDPTAIPHFPFLEKRSPGVEEPILVGARAEISSGQPKGGNPEVPQPERGVGKAGSGSREPVLEKTDDKEIGKTREKKLGSLNIITDARTGFRGKAVILSEHGMQVINEEIPGKKLFCFIDFDHMSVPNKFGFGTAVDKFVGSFPKIAAQAFGNTPYECLRLGGDEFGIILPNTVVAKTQLKTFFDLLEASRKLALPEGKDFEDAQKFAALRTAMRKVRKKYLEEAESAQKQVTLQGYSNWLQGQGAVLPKSVEGQELSLARQVGLLQRSIAEMRIQSGQEPALIDVLTASQAVMDVGDSPTPEQMMRAIRHGDGLIHQAKRSGKKTDTSLHPLESTEESQDLAYERENFKLREKRYHDLQRELGRATTDKERESLQDRMHTIRLSDAAIDDVVRFDVVKEKTAQEILRIKEPTSCTLLQVDIPGFGAINNNVGYAFGDKTYRNVSSKITSAMEASGLKSYHIRKGGGEMLIVVKGSVESVKLSELSSQINQYLKEALSDPRVLMEASEKEALDASREDISPLKKDLDFATINLASETKTITPESIIKNLYEARSTIR